MHKNLIRSAKCKTPCDPVCEDDQRICAISLVKGRVIDVMQLFVNDPEAYVFDTNAFDTNAFGVSAAS